MFVCRSIRKAIASKRTDWSSKHPFRKLVQLFSTDTLVEAMQYGKEGEEKGRGSQAPECYIDRNLKIGRQKVENIGRDVCVPNKKTDSLIGTCETSS